MSKQLSKTKLAELRQARKEKIKRLERALRKQVLGYIVAAFGLVAGLAWNDAIKMTIEYVFPFSANTIVAKLVYALIMTIIVVLISLYMISAIKDEVEKKS